jgi:predicted permease
VPSSVASISSSVSPSSQSPASSRISSIWIIVGSILGVIFVLAIGYYFFRKKPVDQKITLATS